MRYINHLSDFQVVINITDKDGNIIAPPLVPWEAVFSDENCVEFKCYFDGTNYTHCIVDGNDIVCFVDNPGFSCGNLRCTFCQHVPSAEYCDGVMDLTQPLQCDIMLSKRESDDSTPITIEASPNWVRGPQGEQGIQGIQGEKGADGFSPIVSLTKQGAISTLSITDAQGEHTTEISDGAKGDDGFSPIVSLNKVDKVTTLTITDAQGTHTATVNDGESVEVVQSTGTSETAVMSQKAVSDALSTKADKTELDSYATKEYVQTNAPQETKESIEEKLGAWLEEDGGEADGEVYTKAEIDALFSGKVNKTDIVQSTGTSTTSVMSQKAVSDAINKLKNAGYLYAGIATPTTNPGTPDGPVFYIASQAGTYSNFGNTEIDSTGIFTWDGTSWSFEKLDFGGGSNIEIINDLTTGGDGNALSAEMGKVLNEKVILDSIDIPFSISNFLNTSGVETSWWDGKCTGFYACNLGDAFTFTGEGSQSRVCAYDENKNFIKLLQSSGGTNITITINNSTIKYVRASGNASDNTKSFAKINYKSIGHLRNDIDELNTELNDNIDDDLTEGYVDGYYVNHNGIISSNSFFAYKEFEVHAGAVINFTGDMHPSLAAIAKKLTSSTFKELVPATAQSVQSFTYTATEDMTIAVSFNKGSGNSITIVTNNVESNRLNIKNLLDAQSQLNQMFNTPDYGLLFDKVAVIGDSLTVGTLDAVSGDDAHAAGGSFGCSWLTCLAKKWGSRIRMHYGMGGSTCYSWLGSNDYGLGLMLKDTIIYDVYFIAYGHNDHGIFTVGTTSDTPTSVTIGENNDVSMETEAANTTFFGNYKKIVNEIRIKAPNALIFMLCTDEKDSSSSVSIGYMNQYIKELAEWYYAQGDRRVFYVDYINSYVRKSGDSAGGHWSTFGYVNIALAINHALNNVIEEYMNTNALKAWGNYLESYRNTPSIAR